MFVQITRKHIKVSKKDIQAKRGGTPHNTETDSNVEKGDDHKATNPKSPQNKASPPFVVNNFEHRHAAQQRILAMQQKQIQEQQRLIEELQYLQKQQMLQQKLLSQQEHAAKLAKLSDNGDGGDNTPKDGVDTIHRTLAHLQGHIAKLQQQLMDNSESLLGGVGSGGVTGPNKATGNGSPGTSGVTMVQDIQITDLDTYDTSRDEKRKPRGFGAGGDNTGDPDLKLDLSHFGEEASEKRSPEQPRNKPESGSTLAGSKFGNTQMLTKNSGVHPSSARSVLIVKYGLCV